MRHPLTIETRPLLIRSSRFRIFSQHHRPSLPRHLRQQVWRRSCMERRLQGHVPGLYHFVRRRKHLQRVTWVVGARPEEKTALGPRERLRQTLPTTVCWAKKRVRLSMCGSPTPYFMRRLVSGVSGGRGVIRAISNPVHRFRPQGLCRRQLNVGKNGRRLDTRCECCLLDDTQCPLYNTVRSALGCRR